MRRWILRTWFQLANWMPTSIPLPPIRQWLWNTGERFFDGRSWPCGCGENHDFRNHDDWE